MSPYPGFDDCAFLPLFFPAGMLGSPKAQITRKKLQENILAENIIFQGCVQYGTGILGTGMDVVSNLPRCPVLVLMSY